MKKKYNIHFNYKPITDEEIAKHQDFDALLKAFHEIKPLNAPLISPKQKMTTFAKLLTLTAVAILLVVASLQIFFYYRHSSSNHPTAFVVPPMPAIVSPPSSYTLTPTRQNVLKLDDALQITIPANAFIDEYGKNIQEAVELRYKKMLDPVDFFLSGVPMVLDSAKVKRQMEASGMIELSAYRNGQSVFLKPNTAIEIALKSEMYYRENHQYRAYRLDTTQRNWMAYGECRIEPLMSPETEARFQRQLSEQMSDDWKSLTQQLANIEATQEATLAALERNDQLPAPPQPYDKHKFATAFDFSEANVQDPYIKELMQKYQNMIWEVAATEQEFEILASDISWQQIVLEKIPNSRYYSLQLSNGGKVLQIKIMPVFMEGEYEKALQQYQFAVAERQRRIDAQKQLLNNQYNTEKEAVQLLLDQYDQELKQQQLAFLSQYADSSNQKQKVVAYFNVNVLGWWACARLLPLSSQQLSLKAQVPAESSQKLSFYWSNNRLNTVGRVEVVNGSLEIPFSNEGNPKIWAVAANGTLVTGRPDPESKTINLFPPSDALLKEEELRVALSF